MEINEQNAAELARKVKAGELPGPARSLAEAMHRVMEHVGYVQKKGTVTVGQGYRYAGERHFIEAVRPELVAQQIVVAPVAMEAVFCEQFQGKSGPQNRVVLRVTFRFTHAPTGQTLDVVTCGEGIDAGDKATNKAMTGAMKYALRQAFVIETGDDPDDTPSATQERAAPAPAPKLAPKDNLPRRAVHTLAYGAAKTRQDFDAVNGAVRRDAAEGQLSAADIESLRGAARQTHERLAAK